MMKEMMQELKSKEYAFGEFRDRFNEFWSHLQNVISMESTRFLGNVIQIDPGKKSETAIHLNFLNHHLVLSYYQVSLEKEYRCLLLLEALLTEGKREYIDHCYFDQKGHIYSKLEDKESQINLNNENFALILLNEASDKLISLETSKARELDGGTESGTES
ncbi:MAG: hypothetical protein ACOCY5_00890 [Desulfohalobiaceae bacterium]